AIGLVVAIFAHSTTSPASPTTAVTQPPPEKPLAEAPPSAAPGDIVVSSGVAVAAEPLDAEVWRGDQNLGSVPVIVDVPEGVPVAIEIRKAGYLTKKIVLDGREKKLTVKLDRERVPSALGGRPKPGRPAAPEPPRGKAKPASGGGEIVNPWAH